MSTIEAAMEPVTVSKIPAPPNGKFLDVMASLANIGNGDLTTTVQALRGVVRKMNKYIGNDIFREYVASLLDRVKAALEALSNTYRREHFDVMIEAIGGEDESPIRDKVFELLAEARGKAMNI